MNILILGGTVLVGRHITESALSAGHDITLFNRGKTNSDLFPDVEKLRGDRDGGLDALKGRTWDVVIDVNGYVPRLVSDSANLLKDNVSQYIYISTGAVYDMPLPVDHDESTPVRQLNDDTSEDVRQYYGELKYLCEVKAQEIMPDRVLVCRLGVIAGRYDMTDRAGYWLMRMRQGGDMVIPGKPEDYFQVVHGRDLADFVVLGAEQNITGTYNTDGEVITWGDWINTAKSISGANTELHWIDDYDFIEEQVGAGWNNFPLYLPPDWRESWTTNSDKAIALGLKHRSTEDIIKDIYGWYDQQPIDYEMRVGISTEDEAKLLSAYQQN